MCPHIWYGRNLHGLLTTWYALTTMYHVHISSTEDMLITFGERGKVKETERDINVREK